MNYYDELLEKIDKLMKDLAFDEAKSLIISELNLPYVPSDIEDKLNDYLSQINVATKAYKSLTDDDIEKYLNESDEKQLLAVDELGKRNLRDYIDICNNYLQSNGFANAKALLIDSLIRQEIDYNFTYVNNCSFIDFNPKKLNVIEETDGFNDAYKIIDDNYMKDPSKAKLGIELLYKEALLSLPNQLDGALTAEKIINYIDDAFGSSLY